ncbi:hypothetical protein [Actinophytocola sp.]|uniref:hypothetical protein n=1 Tax=Actinophytocola sp. TaxID=1872138 RepID=UPI002ED35E1B
MRNEARRRRGAAREDKTGRRVAARRVLRPGVAARRLVGRDVAVHVLRAVRRSGPAWLGERGTRRPGVVGRATYRRLAAARQTGMRAERHKLSMPPSDAAPVRE